MPSHVGRLAPPGKYNWNCAHWCHLVNTIELVPHAATLSPQPKWQIDGFSHFCTTHHRKSLYFTMDDPLPQNCPFSSIGGSRPHLIYDSLGHSEPTIQTTSWSGQPFVFAQVTAECLYFTMAALSPQNWPFPWRDLEPYVKHDSLGPSKLGPHVAEVLRGDHSRNPFGYRGFLHTW